MKSYVVLTGACALTEGTGKLTNNNVSWLLFTRSNHATLVVDCGPDLLCCVSANVGIYKEHSEKIVCNRQEPLSY